MPTYPRRDLRLQLAGMAIGPICLRPQLGAHRAVPRRRSRDARTRRRAPTRSRSVRGCASSAAARPTRRQRRLRANLSTLLVFADLFVAAIVALNVRGDLRVVVGLAFCVGRAGVVDRRPAAAQQRAARDRAHDGGGAVRAPASWPSSRSPSASGHLTALQLLVCALCLPSLLWQALERRWPTESDAVTLPLAASAAALATAPAVLRHARRGTPPARAPRLDRDHPLALTRQVHLLLDSAIGVLGGLFLVLVVVRFVDRLAELATPLPVRPQRRGRRRA